MLVLSLLILGYIVGVCVTTAIISALEEHRKKEGKGKLFSGDDLPPRIIPEILWPVTIAIMVTIIFLPSMA